MYNQKRTLEAFGYDIENKKRRTKGELAIIGKTKPKDMLVVDNCPNCGIERTISLNQSRKNKLCSKCFHNLPSTIKAKQNQNKVKSEETKQKMRDNHWSTKGMQPAFKGKKHTNKTTNIIKAARAQQILTMTEEEKIESYKKVSCTKRGIPLEKFNGFSSTENARIRQSGEYKAWSYDILAKSNFTCVKCNERGGQLTAHHKNGFNAFPEQRFDTENGVCLCHDCHEKFHSAYGKGDNTKEQYEEWVNT